MKNFELGREFQVLESRIESLESLFGKANGHNGEKQRHAGLAAMTEKEAGVMPHSKPQYWKPEKALQLPPFLLSLFGLPGRFAQFDIMPESKTWTCHPEPLILYVNWLDVGGTDEFYRLENQTFSVVRVTEPNSGQISCTATYSARLKASGKAKSHVFPPTGDPRYQQDAGYTSTSAFKITMKNAQGAPLGSYTSFPYSIACHDDSDFVLFWDFNAGLYDLVAGASWEVIGAQTVDHC